MTIHSFSAASTVTSICSDGGDSAATGHETDPTEMMEPCTPRRPLEEKISHTHDISVHTHSPTKNLNNTNGSPLHKLHSNLQGVSRDAGKALAPPRVSSLSHSRQASFYTGPERSRACGQNELYFQLYPSPPILDAVPKVPISEPQQSQVPLHDLSAKHLSRLITALVNCPMVQFQVRRQWWDDMPWKLSSSDTANTPFLTSSDEIHSADDSPGITPIIDLYWRDSFNQDPKSTASIRNIIDDLITNPDGQHQSGGISIVDSRAEGAPVLLSAKGFHDIGHCTFAELAYGASTAVSLHIDPPLPRGRKTCTVTVRVTAQIQERRSYVRTALLVAEMDVTEAFARTALAEYTIQSTATHSNDKNSDHDNDNDIGIDTVVDKTIATFSRLRRETCTMQVLTLLSALERARRCYSDFVVVDTTGPRHATGVPQTVQVPWISASMAAQSSSASRSNERTFRETVVSLVAANATDDGPIVSTLPSGLLNSAQETKRFSVEYTVSDNDADAGDCHDMILHCVPVHQGLKDEWATTWVCFVRSLADSVADADEDD